MKKVALYDPYLDVMGGGEKHILSIIEVLESEGAELTFFWDKDIRRELQEKLHITFRNKVTFLPIPFEMKGNAWEKIKLLSNYDYFFYVTDGSYFFSFAKKTIIFCMYPRRELYNMNLVNKVKTLGNTFIANSYFTKSNLQRWGVHANVIYPYINSDLIQRFGTKKREPVILSIGRFFKHLHAKKQDLIIDAFLDFKKQYPSSLKLVLAGGVKHEDAGYFEMLQSKIKNEKDIKLLPNVGYERLVELYQTASYYWHFTGFGVDDSVEPYAVEHLGITPLEAMATGPIVFAYRAGGLRETVKNNETGYLFGSTEELFSQMKEVMKNKSLQEAIRMNAHTFIRSNFSEEVFIKRVKEIVL